MWNRSIRKNSLAMIIYNVTVKVDKAIAADWLEWMQSDHIPAILATKCFNGYKLVQVLEPDDSDDPTYAVQYFADSMEDYKNYISEHAAEMRKQATDKWGDSFVAFRSLLREIA
jgi:hypothetical protein